MDKRTLIVVGTVLVQAVTIGCLFAYGVFFTILESEFGWSRTLLSVATSMAFVVMGMGAYLAGRLSDAYGPRGVLTVTALSTGLAYVAMSFINAPWQLLLIYGVLVGLGLATHDVVTLSTVARHFPRRKGSISGVVKVGAACGQMIVPLVAVGLIAAFGWRDALLMLGAGAAVLLLIAAWMVGIEPKNVQNDQTMVVEKKSGATFQQARGSREFITLCAMQFFCFGTLITIPTHIVSHGVDVGMTSTAAASVLSTVAAASVCGRLGVGGLIDRFGGRRCYNLCLAMLLLSLLLLLVVKQIALLYLFALFYGMAHGGLFTVVSPAVAEYFGMRAHGAIFGAIVLIGTLGGACLPILTGFVFDKQGSYQWAFTMLAMLVSIALLLSFSLKPADKARVHAV